MIKVPVTKDDALSISFDFDNKIFGININFEKWSLVLNDKVIFKSFEWIEKETKEKMVFTSKIEDLKKPENQVTPPPSSPPPAPIIPTTTKGEEQQGQQIQPPLKDQKMQRLMVIFESLYGLNDKVSVKVWRQEAIKSGVFRAKEFNEYLNEALSKDLIEETEEIGYYKMRK